MRYGWRPYVSQDQRKRRAKREIDAQAKSGRRMSPVELTGRTIASTFWGKAWCENLERYSDFANRLPRGRTYVRNGSVLDLELAPGRVNSKVMGSTLYRVTVEITPLAKARWTSLCESCAGAIDSAVELLQGRFARGVMEQLCARATGLFPAPSELKFDCTCPDWASMCKHVAATLYGVGARLDHSPELFFVMRGVDPTELLASAGAALASPTAELAQGRRLADEALDELFGIELGGPVTPSAARPPQAETSAPRATKATGRASARKPTTRAKTPAKKPAAKSPPTARPNASPAAPRDRSPKSGRSSAPRRKPS